MNFLDSLLVGYLYLFYIVSIKEGMLMRFKINNNEWNVLEKSSEIMIEKYKKEVDDRATFAFGLTMFSQHEIWINKDMCIDQKIRTLKHELTHCFIYSYGLYNVPDFNEEMVCDLVASINDFINEVIEQYKEKENA